MSSSSASDRTMPPPTLMTLEELGIPGTQYLRETLTSCTDPLKAIEEFQNDNGILLPSLRPMLPLLDLHGIHRLEFHSTVLEELRDRLVEKIADIGKTEPGKEKDKKLKELLIKSFSLIKIKHIRPVVMAVLKQMPQIDKRYLKVLVDDKELYDACDTEVKRHIWIEHQSLFGEEVSPLLSQYVKEKETVLFNNDNMSNAFFTPSPKVRRQGEVVQKLAQMVGSSIRLYDIVLQFLRTLFLRTKNTHYCTLRAELLMALHDMEVQEIIAVDPCHKFAWCLDACIREKNVDVKRSRELQGFLDSIRRGQEQVLGDLSMILCDPFAINFLATSAIKILQHLIGTEGMPRDNSVLILLLRMLALGLSAWEMIHSQEFREPRLDSQVVTKFLPSLVSLMVDDQVRSLSSKLPPDDRERASIIIEHSGPPPDAYQAYVTESRVSAILAMYYTLQLVRQKDKVGLMRVLGSLGQCQGDLGFDDPFLHSLVSGLIASIPDEFSAEEFVTAVFDEFFMSGIARENVIRHMIRLMFGIHSKLSQPRLHTLMKTLQTASFARERTKGAYQSLADKVKLQVEPTSGDSAAEESESPLISVPTPTPAK